MAVNLDGLSYVEKYWCENLKNARKKQTGCESTYFSGEITLKIFAPAAENFSIPSIISYMISVKTDKVSKRKFGENSFSKRKNLGQMRKLYQRKSLRTPKKKIASAAQRFFTGWEYFKYYVIIG